MELHKPLYFTRILYRLHETHIYTCNFLKEKPLFLRKDPIILKLLKYSCEIYIEEIKLQAVGESW